MRSPAAALIWDIWWRHRTLVCVLIALTVFTSVFNVVLPENLRMGGEDKSDMFDAGDAVRIVNFHLILAALLLFLAICSYTDFNVRQGSIGFPYRLFTLPLTTFQLVAFPIALGVVGFEFLGLLWRTLVFRDDLDAWGMLLIGVYVVVHQTVLWTLPRLGFLRMLVLGVVGIVFIVAFGLPTFPQDTLPWWLRVNVLTVWLLLLAFGSFLTSWAYVGRQRSGGGSSHRGVIPVVHEVADALPRRTKPFASPAAAQFWFEWRRSGFLLPLLVCATLVTVIGPLSLVMGDDGTVRILIATFALPIVLALPVGKAFSKPDLRSTDMSIPSFIAVKPFSTEDLIATKMKVAALSTGISWLLICSFLSLWFALSGSLDRLALTRSILWAVHGHSVYPQYVLAIFLLAAGMSLTWRYLVGSLWVGLSGNRKLFASTALPYSFAPVFLLLFAVIASNNGEAILDWTRHGFGRALPTMVRIAVIAVVAKFWLAAWSWRGVSPSRVRQYVALWFCGTLVLTVSALSFWQVLRSMIAADSHQLRSLLILAVLLVFPFARVGLAPSWLARNRHRS
jgi:hypothetical protein